MASRTTAIIFCLLIAALLCAPTGWAAPVRSQEPFAALPGLDPDWGLWGDQSAPAWMQADDPAALPALDINNNRPWELGVGSLSAVLGPPDQAYRLGLPAFFSPVPDATAPPDGGYLAMQWRDGAWGVTLGGGYQRNAAVSRSASSPAGSRRLAMSTASRTAASPSSSRSGPLTRWSAYLAAPYRITDAIGLRPEVSYIYEDQAGAGQVSDEWVLGLQFSFGF